MVEHRIESTPHLLPCSVHVQEGHGGLATHGSGKQRISLSERPLLFHTQQATECTSSL